jgi:polysaccharide export outer membrane protein
MRYKLIFIVFIAVVAAILAPPVGAQDKKAAPLLPSQTSYVVGPGDVLEISVWKEESLTKSVIVLPDGAIHFPLIGEIEAAGKTVAEIKENIKSKITAFVPEPVLSVEVKQVNSMIIFVLGRVNSPGKFAVNARSNVLQGIAMAGGLNPFAKRNDIKVIRQGGGKGGEKPQYFIFRYDDVADGDRLEKNIWLERGDIILVP